VTTSATSVSEWDRQVEASAWSGIMACYPRLIFCFPGRPLYDPTRFMSTMDCGIGDHMIIHCTKCKRHTWDPASFCPNCTSDEAISKVEGYKSGTQIRHREDSLSEL